MQIKLNRHFVSLGDAIGKKLLIMLSLDQTQNQHFKTFKVVAICCKEMIIENLQKDSDSISHRVRQVSSQSVAKQTITAQCMKQLVLKFDSKENESKMRK